MNSCDSDTDIRSSRRSNHDNAILVPYANYSLLNPPVVKTAVAYNYLPHHIIHLQGKAVKNAISFDTKVYHVVSKIQTLLDYLYSIVVSWSILPYHVHTCWYCTLVWPK